MVSMADYEWSYCDYCGLSLEPDGVPDGCCPTHGEENTKEVR